MILSIVFLVVAVWAQGGLLPIRTGISQLQVGNLNYASFNLNYKTSLPDAVYNSAVSVSYVQNFNTANGINVSSVCPTTTATGMGCTIKSGNPNEYNVVYISYVVSDIGSLLVGTYSKTFSFTTAATLTQNVVFKPNVDSQFINSGNSLYVQLYPYVAGIGSIDSDFSLNIDSSKFDAISLNISLGVTLKEVHVKDVTVIFGFMLFDSSVITVSLFEGQSLTPGNIPQGFVYGIKTIKTAPPKRLLQIAPFDLSKFVDPFKKILSPSQMAILNKVISAFDAFNIYPEIQNSTFNKAIVAGNKSDTFKPLKPSDTLQLLRGGPAGISQLRFKNVYLNPSIFSTVNQIVTIENKNSQILVPLIDTNSSIMDALKSIGLFTAPKSGVQHRAVHFHQITPKTPPPDTIAPPIVEPTPQAAGTSTPVDNNMFNNLFASNGFVIMTSATDIDQIYFYEVDPVQNIPSAKSTTAAAAPVFIRSTVTNQKTTTSCNSGETKVGVQTQVDVIQKKMVVSCKSCPTGSYLDPNTKNCVTRPSSPPLVPLPITITTAAATKIPPPPPPPPSTSDTKTSVLSPAAAPTSTSKGSVAV